MARAGGAALGRRAQGEVHFQADVVLDAQDPEDAGPGQREGPEREGGPGLEPGRENGRPKGYMVLGAANAGAQPRAPQARVGWSDWSDSPPEIPFGSMFRYAMQLPRG